MKKIFLILFWGIIFFFAKSQTTTNPRVESRNNYYDIVSITLTETNTIVEMRVPKSHHKNGKILSATVLVPVNAWPISEARDIQVDVSDFPGYSPNNPAINNRINQIFANVKAFRKTLSDNGWLIRGLGDGLELDQSYKPARGNEYMTFTLLFDRLPEGIENVYIRELNQHSGKEWYGIKINNPRPSRLITSYNNATIKPIIDDQDDGIVGIYEGTIPEGQGVRYTLGCIKIDNEYKLIYLGDNMTQSQWKPGEVKCELSSSATNGLFKGDWYMFNKMKNSNCYVSFNGPTMSVLLDGNREEYIKMYPNSSSSSKSNSSSGTGFFLSRDGYIVTNYHVIEKYNSIKITGVRNSFDILYKAEVIVVDKQNDLAILRISDSSFKPLNDIPYSFDFAQSNVGEDCFVLGYPLVSSMGTDIKLTTGIISSKSGYEGNVSQYQISAPVQPGNSGAPVFNKNGSIIGIVQAKHTQADNAGYAVKTSYLKNLLDVLSNPIQLPQTNKLVNKTLPQQVEMASACVCLIVCEYK